MAIITFFVVNMAKGAIIVIHEELESNVKSYCRSFPTTFGKAKGSILYSSDDRPYIDFFAGAGALNYGHNHPYIKERLIAYLQEDSIIHGLDMYTEAKQQFMTDFQEHILSPRGMEYKLQFCGPTGTNAVEAAMKIARKVTQRAGIISFMGGFHGMSLGSLAATSNRSSRAGAGMPLHNVTFIPYCDGYLKNFDTLGYLEALLSDTHSGVEKPAAVIIETVQAEGGIYVAPAQWLEQLAALCKQHDVLLIVDDIQVGCGRTGSFFSFERTNVQPDLIVLSKSISGYGLPMSLLLLKPELDVWSPGEHNGTFRGNQMAFVGASAALELRSNENLDQSVLQKGAIIENFLRNEIKPLIPEVDIRGIGLIWGIDFGGCADPMSAERVAKACFQAGLIIERVGRNDTVLKIMPPLMIEQDLLLQGCEIIKQTIRSIASGEPLASSIL
ncbi:diaminobutyrate--2-oxoglutarate transaminase [Paenibacillus sp. P3E]|uniref:diaminobutyrate--2-oxoglutarate transaminase n=1 Tax=Paenibacillus sp. P3E TaxID=1349435 RepID=UPI000AA9A63A